LRADFVETFVDALGPLDRVYWLEVFYAGGTTVRDFSSADIVQQISGRGLASARRSPKPRGAGEHDRARGQAGRRRARHNAAIRR
jgi:UDP-N-acetylmuramate-alanine ligase